MNDSLASQQKSKKTGGDVLSARLLYLALKCPLLQGKHCQTETVRPVEPQPVKTVKPPRKDDALVELRIVLPMVCASRHRTSISTAALCSAGRLSAV